MLRHQDFFAWNLFPIIRNLESSKYVSPHIGQATSLLEEMLRQISLWAEGNIALINRSSSEVQVTLLRNSTQPILLHHQPSHLTYRGVTAMDVHGQDEKKTLIG